MRLSSIRTGVGDDGYTKDAKGNRIGKGHLRIRSGNTCALSRNFLVLAEFNTDVVNDYIKTISWNIGAALSYWDDEKFPSEYRDTLLNKINNFETFKYPDFVCSTSKDYAKKEIAITYVRQLECECWELSLRKVARYLNVFSDYLFMIMVLDHADEITIIDL